METAFQSSPYKGDQPYIFISYAHKNSNEALSIIHTLQAQGYRVWYDEGIDPGTEWDENIAVHVEKCHFFIALLSDEYLESSNCKDELNYARDCEKERLLIYLSDVQLPAGMKMRLSRLQAIHKYRYSSQEGFWAKLLETPGIAGCLEIAADSENALKGRGEKDGAPVGGPAGIKIPRIFSRQSETESEKTDFMHPSYTKAAPLSPNEAEQTAADENEGNDFDADFAHALLEAGKAARAPELVTGVVTKVSFAEVVVDIGTAHTAVIPRDEWSFDSAFDATISLPAQVKKGDQITAAVVSVNDADGVIILSRRVAEEEKAWVSIKKAEKDHSLLDGIIIEENAYGVVASIGGILVFIPKTENGLSAGSPLSKLLHRKVRVMITAVDENRRRVVGSIRAIK